MNETRKTNYKENKLILIPKVEAYIEYILGVIEKLPRVEKFNIGNETKKGSYEMLENIIYLSKSHSSYRCLELLNRIDASLLIQRIFLRMMCKNRWMSEHSFNVAIEKIAQMGKIVGGLINYYAKNTKE